MCTVYCAYHAVSKSQTNKNNCQIMLKRAETDVVHIQYLYCYHFLQSILH